MSEIVFILGAGASKEAGAPTMTDFLDEARRLSEEGKVDPFGEDFERVFKAISALQIVYSKANIDLDNIESVFAAFEMGRLIKRLPRMSTEDIERLPISMRRVILKTLEATISYPVKENRVYPPYTYNSFAKLIKNLIDKKIRCSIITFNYDLALDYALYFNGVPVNYCLSESPKEGYFVPLAKLHGSLNWAKCSKCGEILPWEFSDFFSKYRPLAPFLPGGKFFNLDIGSKLSSSDLKHCGEKVDSVPFIIPPTWNKTEYSPKLETVWINAASELSEAENIFVIGYSLPESDLFFKYLYGVGSIGRARIRLFGIINPSPVSNKFANLLGQDIKLGKFLTMDVTFRRSIETIGKKFLDNEIVQSIIATNS